MVLRERSPACAAATRESVSVENYRDSRIRRGSVRALRSRLQLAQSCASRQVADGPGLAREAVAPACAPRRACGRSYSGQAVRARGRQGDRPPVPCSAQWCSRGAGQVIPLVSLEGDARRSPMRGARARVARAGGRAGLGTGAAGPSRAVWLMAARPHWWARRLSTWRAGVTPETAWLLSQALDTTPEFWLNLQACHDLAVNKPARKVRRLEHAS